MKHFTVLNIAWIVAVAVALVALFDLINGGWE